MMEPLYAENADYDHWCAIPKWNADEFVADSQVVITWQTVGVDVDAGSSIVVDFYIETTVDGTNTAVTTIAL